MRLSKPKGIRLRSFLVLAAGGLTVLLFACGGQTAKIVENGPATSFQPLEARPFAVPVENTGDTTGNFWLRLVRCNPDGWRTDDQEADLEDCNLFVEDVAPESTKSGTWIITAPFSKSSTELDVRLHSCGVKLLSACLGEEETDSATYTLTVSLPPVLEPSDGPILEDNTSDYLRLAQYWAPVVFQDTAEPIFKADYLAAWDYDGNQNPRNNWENLDDSDADLGAVVYYWVVDTENHWYVGYGFFHPRDWGESQAGIIQCTQNEDPKKFSA